MPLKISKNLMKNINENNELKLDKEESTTPRLIINMGKKEKKEPIDYSDEGIIKYVKEHTSGKKEHYDLAEGGSIMVTFDKFVEMVNEGYNIYYSEVLNKDYISIRYQREIKREGRGR